MIRLLAAGDFCPIRRIEETMLGTDPESIYGDVLPILRDKDISLVNLECSLTEHSSAARKSGPNLKAHPSCANSIRLGGFDVVTLANNHIMDYGSLGLTDTQAACRLAGLHFVGAGSDLPAASAPLIVSAAGEEVAVLAFAEHEFGIATPAQAGVNPLDPITNYHQIRAARARTDNVIVVIHGGHEYYPLPSPRMLQVYRFLAEAGASMVIGHHPHVPGAYELHDGVPIVYSLGNFLFDWRPQLAPEFNIGMLVRATLDRGAVTDFELVPYAQGATHVSLRLMHGAERETFLAAVNQHSECLSDPALVNTKWRAFCASQRNYYLAHALRLPKLLRWLLRRNIFTRLISMGARNPAFLNVIRCEAHHDALVETLEAVSTGTHPEPDR